MKPSFILSDIYPCRYLGFYCFQVMRYLLNTVDRKDIKNITKLKIIGHKLKKKQYVGSLINTVKGYKLSLFSVLFLSTVSLHICLQPNTLEDNVFSIVKETSIRYFKYNKYIIHRHKLNTCTNPRQT